MVNFYENKSELIAGKRSNDKIEISYVIPTYKRYDTLFLAIQSITQQMQQTINYEIIIVSNDPNEMFDTIKSEFKSYNVRFYRNKINLGMCENMNQCYRLATGKYIVYLQDDDFLLPWYYKNIRSYMNKMEEKNIDCIIPLRYFYIPDIDELENSMFNVRNINRLRKKIKLQKCFIFSKLLEKKFHKLTEKTYLRATNNCFLGGPTCGIVFKRKSLENFGGFDKQYKYAFDIAFFTEFSKEFNVYILNEYLSVYRMALNASNNANTQVDFFYTDVAIREKASSYNKYVCYFYNEILYFLFTKITAEAQKIIIKENKFKIKKNKYKYYLYLLSNYSYNLFYNLYKTRLLPPNIEKYVMHRLLKEVI